MKVMKRILMIGLTLAPMLFALAALAQPSRP